MFLSYLKRHYKIIILFSLFIIIFAVVFSLYELKAEAVLYAAVLCLFVGIIAFAFGLWRYISRHKKLKTLLRNIDLGIYGLPEPDGLIEADYQEMLHELYAQNLKIRGDADSARRDMEDYYTLWAHQIKTPIAAMRLLLSEDKENNGSLLLGELFKTEQYVDMVLQYVRLSSESSDLLLQKYSLDEIIKGALRKYARLFALKNLEFEFTETGLTVLTDEKWLSFVIEQIFSNSLKYTQSGKISIYAENEKLVIEDTGIGIRAEDLPRVCEKGYTGASGRADKKSTGIGLFLCKSILTKLGHGLEIKSKVGKGTRVRICLHRENVTFE
jgi:signal transduction histidine kinase